MEKKSILILILSLLFSLSLIPIWGLAFLKLGTANQYTGFVAMLFTFYAPHFIPKVQNKIKLQHCLLLSGAIFYMLIGIYAQGWRLLVIPIFWAFILYLVALFIPKTRSPFVHLGVVTYAILCFWGIYPITDHGMERLALQEDMEEPIAEINTSVNLSQFLFVASDKDTVRIGNGKPVLIETWNETCAPCMASIRDLQTEFEKDTNFQYIYLYQYRGKDSKLSTAQIFDFQAIKDKRKIRIDIENRLFDQMKLESYPFFLVFDRQGNLVGHQMGYISSQKDEIVQKLRKFLKK